MAIVEGLQFRYALHELAPGRYPFRRWRWELWHGQRLEATGWCLSEQQAAQSLRRHGARVGHRIFGLRPSPPAEPDPPFALRPGTLVRVQVGGVSFSLAPRHLDDAALASSPALR